MKTKIVVITLILLSAVVHLNAQTNATLPGLYLTNAIVLPNGAAQLEVRTPDATNAFALLYSHELQTWNFVMALTNATNRHVITFPPGTISEIDHAFLRVAPLGQAIYSLQMQFETSWNGGVVNGTPAMEWPHPLQWWRVELDVDNSTNFPPASEVLFSGPAGSGITNLPAASWSGPFSDFDHMGEYSSDASSTIPGVLGGTWHVQYATNSQLFMVPDPQLATRYLVMVPKLQVENGELSEVSWTYCDPDTGEPLASAPNFIRQIELRVFGGDFSLFGWFEDRIFENDNLPGDATNCVFSPPLEWTNSLLSFKYVDTLNNGYSFEYSFGNLYEVYGGDSFTTSEPEWWEKGFNPSAYGYTYLGAATNTTTFPGAHNFYIVRIPKHNNVKVDTVRGSTGVYYGTSITGSIDGYTNIGGPPDGLYASVAAGWHALDRGGFFVVNATGQGLTDLSVFVAP